jgi:hypothetical protein
MYFVQILATVANDYTSLVHDTTLWPQLLPAVSEYVGGPRLIYVPDPSSKH